MERSHAVFLSLLDRPPRPIAAPERAVLCLGNFDGVHVAHRALIRAGVRSARAGGCRAESFAFTAPRRIIFRLFLHRKRHMHPARTCARFPKSWRDLRKRG